MKKLLGRLFALRPGEEKKTLMLAFLGLLWSFAATTSLKFADALFLTRVGAEELPNIYTIASLGLILLSSVQLYVFHHICSYKIFRSVFGIGILFFAALHICLQWEVGVESSSLWYTFRIFSTLYFTVLMTSYWTFIDQYFKKEDAKRLFVLFSSSIFAGMICTGLAMKTAIVNLNTLYPTLIVLLLLAGLWIKKIHKELKPDHEEISAHPELHQRKTPLLETLKQILFSRFSLLIILRNFLTIVLGVIAEYNYLSAFNQYFSSANQEEALAQFFGQWVTIVAVCNVIFGLLIYGRLVTTFGIGTVLFYTPILFIFLFSGWMVDTSLFFPMMGFFIYEGSLYIIDDSNFSLLLKTGPTPIKSNLRILTESVFEPLGMLFSGYLLSFSGLNSKLLGLSFACSLLVVIFAMRILYFSKRTQPKKI